MPLIKPQQSQKFLNALKQREAKHPDVIHTTLDTVGVVGAGTDWDYEPDVPELCFSTDEEIYLNASNRHLSAQGFAMGSKPDIQLCDLSKKSDLLDGGFENFKPELLVLSSLCYCPEDLRALGEASQQSPFANDPKKWISTFNDLGAKAIVNMWFKFDQRGGQGLDNLIQRTGEYKRVFTTPKDFIKAPEDHLNADDYTSTKGGSLYIHNDLF